MTVATWSNFSKQIQGSFSRITISNPINSYNLHPENGERSVARHHHNVFNPSSWGVRPISAGNRPIQNSKRSCVLFKPRGGEGRRRHNQRTVASLITLILRSPVRLTAVWGWGGGRKGEPALNRVRSSRAKCKTDVCVR